MPGVMLGPVPPVVEGVDTAVPDERLGSVARGRPWAAIDVAVESRLDRESRRKPTWRELLFSWLIEFNRY